MSNEIETKKLRVFDTSCTHTHPKRVHDIIVGGKLNEGGRIEQVVFNYGEPTVLPEEIALKFRKDGFRVETMEGNVYEAARAVDSVVASRLAPGETIAQYTELKREALFLRASVIPGGESLKKASNDELIKFLMDNADDGMSQGGAAKGDGESLSNGDVSDETMSDDAMKAMLAEEGATDEEQL
jgi:hypothetical protein